MEIWKDIIGFTNYQVSNFGNVRRVGGNLLSPFNTKGYLRVTLYLKGKQYKFMVSRLVALHFVPNPNNLPEVRHDDDIKTNNHYTNLYWTDRLENMHHNNLQDKLKVYHQKRCKAVIQLTIEGIKVKEWKSSISTESANFNRSTVIACCKNKRNTHKGYRWMYLSDYENLLQ